MKKSGQKQPCSKLTKSVINLIPTVWLIAWELVELHALVSWTIKAVHAQNRSICGVIGSWSWISLRAGCHFEGQQLIIMGGTRAFGWKVHTGLAKPCRWPHSLYPWKEIDLFLTFLLLLFFIEGAIIAAMTTIVESCSSLLKLTHKVGNNRRSACTLQMLFCEISTKLLSLDMW